MTTVVKIGGTSLATADRFHYAASILRTRPDCTVCVVSAPGKTAEYLKMTDLLIHDHTHACIARVTELVRDLHFDLPALETVLAKLEELRSVGTVAARVSYGEWLSAYLLSHLTGWRMVDACEVVFFAEDRVSINTPWQPGERVIVPGFYGHDVASGNIRTFSRGGSDITASLIAAQVSAKLCENWTDVRGVFDKDPNQYDDAILHEALSYAELLEVAHGGAQVFHPEAIAPLQTASIPLCIKSTFEPYAPGTLVT